MSGILIHQFGLSLWTNGLPTCPVRRRSSYQITERRSRNRFIYIYVLYRQWLKCNPFGLGCDFYVFLGWYRLWEFYFNTQHKCARAITDVLIRKRPQTPIIVDTIPNFQWIKSRRLQFRSRLDRVTQPLFTKRYKRQLYTSVCVYLDNHVVLVYTSEQYNCISIIYNAYTSTANS